MAWIGLYVHDRDSYIFCGWMMFFMVHFVQKKQKLYRTTPKQIVLADQVKIGTLEAAPLILISWAMLSLFSLQYMFLVFALSYFVVILFCAVSLKPT